MNGLKLVAIEVSEEAKLKLKKMNEKREERMKKLVEDYKNGKLKQLYGSMVKLYIMTVF